MKASALAAILGVTALAAATAAGAAKPIGACDVVQLSGSGTRLANGAIVGSETLTIVATGEEIPVTFSVVPLGVTAFEDGSVTYVTSHEFTGVNHRNISFTTFEEIKSVPLAGDPSCVSGACGLVFKLVLEKGSGDYNCGAIVSGYDPATLTSFTSTLEGDTLQLNSVGKLCNCGPQP